jgi:hypothetical protein
VAELRRMMAEHFHRIPSGEQRIDDSSQRRGFGGMMRRLSTTVSARPDFE